jgi:hypothetical protein
MHEMEVEREEEIRQLAYRIWQEEGYPHGYEVQHWLKAEAIWLEEQRAKSMPKQRKPATKTATKKTKSRKTVNAQHEL